MVQALEDTDVQDLPHAVRLLGEMNTNVQQVTELVDNMLKRVKNGEITTAKGLSFLEMKYHMLLSYLINLTYVVLRKCSGEKIECDPVIDRLVEIRTILEKIRPIDSKLKYQIDKLVKTAVTGTSNEKDPSSFKANPANLISKLDGGDTESENSDDQENGKEMKETKKGIYVPPKLAAVHYDGDETKIERNQRQLERAKKRALSSAVMQELKEEYLDSPTEISGGSRAQQAISRKQKEREEYEETYLTRLPLTKQEKHRQRKLTTLGTLGDEVTQFGDFSVLDGGNASSNNKRKRKTTTKNKGKAKKKRFH